MKVPKISGVRNVVDDIKDKVHKEDHHAKAIPYHRAPFYEQIAESQSIIMDLTVEVKTRKKALKRLLSALMNARQKSTLGNETNKVEAYKESLDDRGSTERPSAKPENPGRPKKAGRGNKKAGRG